MSLSADARALWWVNAVAVDGAFHVLTMAKTGGEPRTRAAADAVGAMSSDGTHVYWERDDGGVSLVR